MESSKYFQQKKGAVVLFFFIMLLSVLQIVSAVPPVQILSPTENTFTLKYPTQQIFMVNETHNLNIHIFNSSTGSPVTTGVACTIHLYNSSGSQIWEQTKSTFSNYDITFTINKGNFSKISVMAYIVQCNSSNAGGYIDVPLEITYSGVELTTARAILNLGFLSLLILLFAGILMGFISIDSENKRSEDGLIVDINNLKYLKGVLFAFGYALLITIFFIAYNISLAYLWGNMFSSILFVLYKIFMIMGIPIVVVWFIWLFVSIFQDKETRNMIERGVQFGGNDI